MSTSPSLLTDLIVPAPLASNQLATRTRSGDIKAIPAALKSELIKLSSVRSNQMMLLVSAIGGLLVSWAAATFMTSDARDVSEAAFYWPAAGAILASVGGVLIFCSEVQHGTLAINLAARPARWVVAVAKTVMAIVLGVAIGLAGVATGIAGATIAGLESGGVGGVLSQSLWTLLYTSIAAVLGLGVGMIVRHSAAAVSTLTVWAFLIEGLCTLFLPAEYSRLLPFLAGDRLLALDTTDVNSDATAVALSRVEGALVFGAYGLLAMVIGTVLLYRRDVD